MQDDLAIKVENVSKKFCKNLRSSMVYGLSDIMRNCFGIRTKSDKLRKDEFWANDNVSFEVKKGEVLGLIGPNGSGKTTMLKMLNGIFWPDKGKISIRGKVGALISVGAGFHPNLTGKENVFINGAILGMKKKEIEEKYDEIVEFAELKGFMETPVKYYSSGMFVRLGFSVAAHCEQDVLLVDEILAVGDSAFRKKCFKRMKEVIDSEDVAIVFVSHSIYQVERFCDKGILLNNGKTQESGDIHNVISEYQHLLNQIRAESEKKEKRFKGVPFSTEEVEIADILYFNKSGRNKNEFKPGEELNILIKMDSKRGFENLNVEISIFNQEKVHVAIFDSEIDNIQINSIKKGNWAIKLKIDTLPLLWGVYFLRITVRDEDRIETIGYWNGFIQGKNFNILSNEISEFFGDGCPVFEIKPVWEIIK